MKTKKTRQVSLRQILLIVVITFVATLLLTATAEYYELNGVSLNNTEKEIIVIENKIDSQPYSIWDFYDVPKVWQQYGKGKNIKVAILEHNYDMSVGLPYKEAIDFYCPYRECDDFEFKGENITHGTEMWGILHNVAPEADIYPLRHYGAYNLESLERALKWCDENEIDIIVSAVLLEFNSEFIDNWIDNTPVKEIILASPPSFQNLYSAIYTHEKTTVIGIVESESNYDEIYGYWSSSNIRVVDKYLPEAYVLTTTNGGVMRQVYGTSPASFVYAGITACKMSKE